MKLLTQVRAQGIYNPAIPSGIGQGTDNGGDILGAIIGSIIGGIIIIAFLMAFLYLLTGGLGWLTSGGDKAKLETARDKITNAIIGLIIVSSVWAIMALVGPFVGFEDFPKIPIPSVLDTINP